MATPTTNKVIPSNPRVDPHLAALPGELVSNISARLGSDDVFAFRLTCKDLAEKSFFEFAVEHYRQKCFIFTTKSLKVLVAMASNDKIAPHLQHIYILTALFSDRALNCCHGAQCSWKPTVRQTEAWHEYVHDQRSLKETGADLQMLTEAFEKLPKFTSLTFLDNVADVPDGVDLQGLTKSIRTTSNPAPMQPSEPKDKEFYRFKNHVWLTLIQALANSGQSTLKHLYTDLDQVKNALSVSTNLDLPDPVVDGLRTALSNLHGARLQISSRKQSHLANEEDDGIDVQNGKLTMREFAGLLPSLQALHLAFTFSPSSWQLSASFLENLTLNRIKVLRLENIYIGPNTLARIIGRLTTIMELRLNWVNLVKGSWKPILKLIQKLDTLDHLHLEHLLVKRERVCLLKPLDAEETPMPPPVPVGVADPFDGGLANYLDGYDSEEDSEEDADYDDGSEEEQDSEEYEIDVSQGEEDVNFLDSNVNGVATTPEIVSAGTSSPTDSQSNHDTDTDASMPDLEAYAASMPDPTPPTSAQQSPSANRSHSPILADSSSGEVELDDTSPNVPLKGSPSVPTDPKKEAYFGVGPERGYHICLQGKHQLDKYIPIFIEEYHEGEYSDLDGTPSITDILQVLTMGPLGQPQAGVPPGGLVAAAGIINQMMPYSNNFVQAFQHQQQNQQQNQQQAQLQTQQAPPPTDG